MASDSREVGLRVGAAFNQASGLATALVENGRLTDDPTTIATYVDELAGILLGKMEATQAALTVGAAFPGTTAAAGSLRDAVPAGLEHGYVAASTPVQRPAYVAPAAATAPPAFASASSETAFSGSTKPLRLAEHTELPGWLHAQAAAVGVLEVWDNRNKPNYVAAISSGSPKTPPPFRSATAGIDKSFWPPAK